MPIDHLISAARATDDFKREVVRYAQGARAERIHTVRHSPRVKVLRLLAQLLTAERDLEIESVSIDAWSGCSDFRGVVAVTAVDGTRKFHFHWDCSWRAEQEGWYDAFNLPDQIRAAREFGWRCFSRWEEQPIARSVRAPEAAH